MGIIEWLDSTLYYARLGLITAVFGTIAVPCGHPAITVNVGQERVVTIPGVDAPVVEPHLSINPRNPNNLIAGAMVAQSDYNYSVIGLSSLDGGLTWYKHEFSAKGAGDVWTAFLADGTAVLSFLAQPDSALQVFRSGDGGRTWSERPATTARGQDHPTLLFGPDGSLYTVSAGYARTKSERARDAIIVTRSADGGASFAGPVSVIASNLLYEAGNPAIAPDGMLLIPFADHHRPGSRRRLQGPRDWMVVSSDGGKTFSEPLLISESCDGRGGWSSLAVFRDRTYHVCPAAELNGIQFRHSENRGETWSEPIRIDHPGDTTPQTRTPAIAVNGEGLIAIAWYDARNDRSTEHNQGELPLPRDRRRSLSGWRTYVFARSTSFKQTILRGDSAECRDGTSLSGWRRVHGAGSCSRRLVSTSLVRQPKRDVSPVYREGCSQRKMMLRDQW